MVYLYKYTTNIHVLYKAPGVVCVYSIYCSPKIRLEILSILKGLTTKLCFGYNINYSIIDICFASSIGMSDWIAVNYFRFYADRHTILEPRQYVQIA